MSSAIEWSLGMSLTDFVKVSEEYFRRRYIDLHIGCCLVARVNPALKKEPVGKGYLSWDQEPDPMPYDYTRRPFDVALRALRGELPDNPLIPAKTLPETIEDARDVPLSTRTFVAWAMKQWPDTKAHLRAAEDHYKKVKSESPAGYLRSKQSAHDQIWMTIRDEFEALKESLGEKADETSVHELARQLAARIKSTPHQRGVHALRKRIGKWMK